MSDEREIGRSDAAQWTVSRRVLMGAAVAASAVSMLPLPASVAAAVASPFGKSPERLTDWTIDDMWGVYPRYAERIDYGRPWTDVDVHIDAIDAQFA
jgi:hypothetical protein